MDNPLLALQVQAPNIDIGGSYGRGQEIQTARLSNILQNYKMAQAQRADQQANALAALNRQIGPGLASGDEGAINQLAKIDPASALDYRSKNVEIQGKKDTNSKTEFDVAKAKAEHVAGVLGAVVQAPDAAKPMAYQWARQQLINEGHDVSKMPTTYSPDILPQLQATTQAALGVKDQIDNHLKQQTQDETIRHDRAGEADAIRGQNITVRGQDLTDARAREANINKAPPGYRQTGDGTLEYIPGGPADPTKGAGKKAPTEDQAKNNQLYQRASQQLPIALNNFDSMASVGNQIGAHVPGTNAFTSEGYQRASNAILDIAASYLYSVSGATANPGEVKNLADTITPKIGESKASVADKKARLQQMVESIKTRATPGGAAVVTPANAPKVINFNDLPEQ